LHRGEPVRIPKSCPDGGGDRRGLGRGCVRRYSALEYLRLGRWTPVRDRVVGASSGADVAGAPATPGAEEAGNAAVDEDGAAGGVSDSESDSRRLGGVGARP
jgi:hypothetical protein